MARTFDGEEIDRSVGSTNFTEFTLKKKPDGKTWLIRAGIIVICVAIFVICAAIAWYLGCLSLLLAIIAWYFTWPFTNIEYEYVTASGEMTFTTIYGGGRKRKDTLKFKIKDCEIIAPYTSEYADKYASVTEVYDFRSGPKQKDDIYFAIFGGKKVLFQCTNKALKIFKSYNKENVVSVDTLRY